MGQMIYNVNDAATQVLAAKQVKENIFVDLVHKNGYGVNQVEETNASTVRIMKVKPFTDSARELGAGTNGKWFNNGTIGTPEVEEYDLNLLYVYDMPVDIPEVEQDMVSVNLMDAATKNIGGRNATEINAATIAHQLAAVYNAADTAGDWTGHASVIGTGDDATYAAVQSASTMLDDGDEENGIQAFPFAERQLIMRPSFRASLLNSKGVLLGGSNYAQSMLAKGAVSPEARKEWGNMYCGEIDGIPCYISPAQIWKRAGEWVGSATAFADTEAVVCAASATDRGISMQDYIKIVDSPNGAGKRLQPKTRWGINVCYHKGIVPIVKSGATVPSAQLTVKAVGSRG
jgi:hypothetical protein